MLPAAVLVVLPKCPLCLAAWLTLATGIGFSATGAAWVRVILVVSWVAAVALAFSPMVRRRFLACTKTSIDSGEEARRPLSVRAVFVAKLRGEQPFFGMDAGEEWRHEECEKQEAYT
jgi:hypothetical protein